MKKTIFIIILLFIGILFLTNNIYAFDAEDETWVGCPIKVEKVNEADKKFKLTLLRNAIDNGGGDNVGIDLVIEEGQTVELDLDGFKLHNYSTDNSTIYIKKGGTLTIVDGKNTGEHLSKY